MFQVKRLDTTFPYYESTLAASDQSQTPQNAFMPKKEEEYLRDTLIYPHPTCSGSNSQGEAIKTPSVRPHNPLVYPHPQTKSPPYSNTYSQQVNHNDNVILLRANGQSASIENRPDMSTDEKITCLKSKLSQGSIQRNQGSQGLNSLASGTLWEQASSLPSKEKLKFLVGLIPGKDEEKQGQNDSPVAGKNKVELLGEERVFVEPLCEEKGSLGHVPVVYQNQDPFETLSNGSRLSDELEQINLPKPTLTPMKPMDKNVGGPTNKDAQLEIEIDCSDKIVAPSSMTNRSSSFKSCSVFEKNRVTKSNSVPPVPLPRTLQMMEGAQSGANAVAIEIPESFHGAAHKEEDAIARGG